MADVKPEDVERLMQKYGQKLSIQLNRPTQKQPQIRSEEFKTFKKDLLPKQFTLYEKACQFCVKIMKVKVAPERYKQLKEHIDICHLETTPEAVDSLSYMLPLAVMMGGAFLSFVLFNSFFFTLFFLITGGIMIFPLRSVPKFMANSWRMKASNQMVLCVFYIVTYMRHTSNLEGAIRFAADHLEPPLSLDLKKVVWNVETEKYESVKESLDMYLETWRKWNNEFIEAIHLIEGSLFEGSEDRRLELLDKSLDVILSETYEKMLHYTHNLKSPITMLHMLGVILPILGLVILPLVVSFLGGVKWYHLSTLYNFILPLGVYFLGRSVLAKRPAGYGDTDISKDKRFAKLKNVIIRFGKLEIPIKPIFLSMFVTFTLVLIGLSPLILGAIKSDEALLTEKDIIEDTGFKFLEYRESSATTGPMVGQIIGPFGLGASLVSLAFPLAFGVGLGLYFRIKTRKLIFIRNESKKLEKEFASALFQLGNRLGDGLPAELAFAKVAETMEGSTSGKFFAAVSKNIQKLGMGVEEAIFGKESGAIGQFPSSIIKSSMKVFIESVKKGPKVAAEALMNISRYIKEIHRVDERLKDLLADIVGSMKSQISFMAPAISGIVIGITSMITTIMGKLKLQAADLAASEAGGGGRMSLFSELFGDGIPTYYFQIVVGIYVVQIVAALSILTNTIENGQDKLNEEYMLGNNMKRSTILYCGIALVVMMIFNLIAGKVVGKAAGMG